MASQSEAAFAFYSTNSGLTPRASFSIHEHKSQYLRAHGGVGVTLDDLMRSVYGVQGEYAYLKQVTGAVGSLDALRTAFYGGAGAQATTLRISRMRVVSQ